MEPWVCHSQGEGLDTAPTGAEVDDKEREREREREREDTGEE